MRPLGSVITLIIILLDLFIITKSEVYIVTVEGEPVVSYQGGLNGFQPIANADSNHKIDFTRFVFFN